MRNALSTILVATVMFITGISIVGVVPFKGYNANFARYYTGGGDGGYGLYFYYDFGSG